MNKKIFVKEGCGWGTCPDCNCLAYWNVCPICEKSVEDEKEIKKELVCSKCHKNYARCRCEDKDDRASIHFPHIDCSYREWQNVWYKKIIRNW